MSYTFEPLLKNLFPRPRPLVPVQRGVRVGCRGETVVLQIGTADPVHWSWREALRTANAWLAEGKAARSTGRPANVKVGHHPLDVKAEDLIQLAGWVLAKGYQARRNAGNTDPRYDP